MIIETKFDVGDKGWILYNNKVKEVNVEEMKVTINNDGRFFKWLVYWCEHDSSLSYKDIFEESEIFRTKQDLLNSL